MRISGVIALLTVLVVMLVVLLIPSIVAGDHSASQSAFTILKGDEDRFYNWDFNSERASRHNVDWPATILFYNNAERYQVERSFYGAAGSETAGRKHFHYSEDGGRSWEWDARRGTKPFVLTCGTNFYHMRVYSPNSGPGRFYNDSWGYYVLGTTHIDHIECDRWSSDRWSGESEKAEKHFNDLADGHGVTVYRNQMQFYNYEPYSDHGSHRVDNSGWASAHYWPDD